VTTYIAPTDDVSGSAKPAIYQAIDLLTTSLVEVQVLQRSASLGGVEPAELGERLDRIEQTLRNLGQTLTLVRDRPC
jgi:hypothetical protein